MHGAWPFSCLSDGFIIESTLLSCQSNAAPGPQWNQLLKRRLAIILLSFHRGNGVLEFTLQLGHFRWLCCQFGLHLFSPYQSKPAALQI